MIEPNDTTIGETQYRVTTLGAKAGQKMLHRLFRIIGPSLADLVRGSQTDGKTGAPNLSLDNIANGVKTFATLLTESDWDAIVESCVGSTQVCLDPSNDAWVPLKKDFELRFAGKHDELIRLVAFYLQVNFAGFFDASMLTALPTGLRATTK